MLLLIREEQLETAAIAISDLTVALKNSDIREFYGDRKM